MKLAGFNGMREKKYQILYADRSQYDLNFEHMIVPKFHLKNHENCGWNKKKLTFPCM